LSAPSIDMRKAKVEMAVGKKQLALRVHLLLASRTL
jgi:hypothetical protein